MRVIRKLKKSLRINNNSMEIKTIGDLRKLMVANGGSLKIGSFEFKSAGDGNDIDVNFQDNLVAWYQSISLDDQLLDEGMTVSSDWDANESKKLRKTNRDLENEIIEMKGKAKSDELALGKVEAYEKLLIGREITISK